MASDDTTRGVHEDAPLADVCIPSRGTVLVVDDEDEMREPAVEALEALGFTVLTARDPSTALRIHGELHATLRLVLLDALIPGRCLDEMLRVDPTTRVILASGHATGKLRRKALARGARDVLVKPYEAVEFLGTICEVLGMDIV